METADYKELLRQAEEELGSTPGAYCSRRAALRAMELLREAGQKEVDQKAAEYKAGAENNYRQWQEQKAVIERQAQAIKRLEEEKTKGVRLGASIGSGIDPRPTVIKDGFMRGGYVGGMDPINDAKPQIIRRSANPENDWLRRGLDPYFENVKQL